MTTRLVALLTCLALLIAACSSTFALEASGPPPAETPDPDPMATPDPADSSDLATARERWVAAGITDYLLIYANSCNCPEEGQYEVSVIDGVLAGVNRNGFPVDSAAGLTVEDFFDRIQATIDANKDVRVTYGDNGLPGNIELDTAGPGPGRELSATVLQLFDYLGLAAQLDVAEARWVAVGITDYTMTYREVCFCPETVVTVAVRGGVVVDVTTDADFAVTGRTVERLFADLRDAIAARAVTILVEYDAELGYPGQYSFDFDFAIADEEFGIVVESFLALEPLTPRRPGFTG